MDSLLCFVSPPGAVPLDSEGALSLCLSGVQVLARPLLRLSVLEANRPQWPTASESIHVALQVNCGQKEVVLNI